MVILPRDPKGQLRSCKLLRGAAPCELSVIAVRWVKKLFPYLLNLSIPNGCILVPSSSRRDFYPHIMKSGIVELTLGCHYPLATERPSYAGTSVHCSALTKKGLDIFINNIQECKMRSWMMYCTFQGHTELASGAKAIVGMNEVIFNNQVSQKYSLLAFILIYEV